MNTGKLNSPLFLPDDRHHTPIFRTPDKPRIVFHQGRWRTLNMVIPLFPSSGPGGEYLKARRAIRLAAIEWCYNRLPRSLRLGGSDGAYLSYWDYQQRPGKRGRYAPDDPLAVIETMARRG